MPIINAKGVFSRSSRSCGQLVGLAAAVGIWLFPLPALADAGGGGSATTLMATSYTATVTEAAQRFGIPEGWIWSVMRAESGGNPHARSPKGALGLMQLMPATWGAMTARYGLGADPFDIRANIHAGAAYLREMWDRYGNVMAMLAAYNAGPRRADAFVMGYAGLPGETTAYVARIVPQIGGVANGSLGISHTPRKASWREAMLFSAQPNDMSDHRGNALPRPVERARDVRPTAEFPAVAEHDDTLFVAVSGGERP